MERLFSKMAESLNPKLEHAEKPETIEKFAFKPLPDSLDFDESLNPKLERTEKLETREEFAFKPLPDSLDFDESMAHSEDSESNPEKNNPIKNKIDGLAREAEVLEELQQQYPAEKGYNVESECFLRDKEGEIVKDPETNESRRVDHMVVKDGQVVDSIEVTSQTADKTEQSAKERRIRENGGNFIKDSNGQLVEIPSDVKTRIERRD